MFYIFLDTCVLLDISTKKQDLPLVSALEELVKCGTVKLVITDLVAGWCFKKYAEKKQVGF